LHALFKKDALSGARYHELQLQLCEAEASCISDESRILDAEFDSARLLPFLRNSKSVVIFSLRPQDVFLSNYDLEKALQICEQKYIIV